MRDEFGSEWHLCELERAGSWPWADHRLTGTARHALTLLVGQLEPPRVWVPSYSCHAFYRALGPRLRVYEDLPGGPVVLPEDPEAMVVVHNPFGLRGPRARGAARWWVEDHTHAPASPWARASEADFCIASLRKTLPMPDGAVLWSPAGHALPEVPAPRTGTGAALKLKGMALKARYLAGEPIEKAGFRAMLAQGEALLGGAIATESLAVIEGGPARPARRRNQQILGGFGMPSEDPAPSFVFLRYPTPAVRDHTRALLIGKGIYPSALWPMELDVSAAARALARCSLALPIDGRMGAQQAERIARLLRVG